MYEEDSRKSVENRCELNGIKGKCWLSYFLTLPTGIFTDLFNLFILLFI